VNSTLPGFARVLGALCRMLTVGAAVAILSAACASSSGGAGGDSTSAIDCSPFASCGACTLQVGCGWCGGTPGSAYTGGFCSAQPLTECATYPQGWTWDPNGCTTSPPPTGMGGAGSAPTGIPAICNTCTANQACVIIGGVTQCAQRCTAGAQCTTGCCVPIDGNAASACGPASLCLSSSGGAPGMSGTPSAGTGGSSGPKGTPGSGGSATTCKSVAGCMSAALSSDPLCQGYVDITNNCGYQITCKYQLGNGQTGCVFPEVGKNACGFHTGPESWTLRCADGQLECDQSIGCGL